MNEAQAAFIAKVGVAARVANAESGIPASITIAQAILQSNWGKAEPAAKYSNFFGIKSAQRSADYVEVLAAAEYGFANFAWYRSVQDCFRAHAWLLSNAERYAPAMEVKDDPESFAGGLQCCGYSTNPKYAETLMDLVRAFNLTRYDVAQIPPPSADEAA